FRRVLFRSRGAVGGQRAQRPCQPSSSARRARRRGRMGGAELNVDHAAADERSGGGRIARSMLDKTWGRSQTCIQVRRLAADRGGEWGSRRGALSTTR